MKPLSAFSELRLGFKTFLISELDGKLSVLEVNIVASLVG